MDTLYDEFDPRPFVNDPESFIRKLVEFEKKLRENGQEKKSRSSY